MKWILHLRVVSTGHAWGDVPAGVPGTTTGLSLGVSAVARGHAWRRNGRLLEQGWMAEGRLAAVAVMAALASPVLLQRRAKEEAA